MGNHPRSKEWVNSTQGRCEALVYEVTINDFLKWNNGQINDFEFFLFRIYVVTAAHCHEPGLAGFEVLEVVLGEHDVATDPGKQWKSNYIRVFQFLSD